MFEAFLWGLFATSSLVIGALVVRLRAPGERLLGVIMAFGAGVLISAVAFELIEEAVGISGGSGGREWNSVMILWSVIAVACAASAALGYAVLDGASPSTLAFTFAFAGGAILAMLADSMMPEAYQHARRWAGIATVFGFGVAFWVNQAAG